MIDTRDLTSYYPGYDKHCEPKKPIEEYDNSDEYYEKMKIREETEKMERKIIDLASTKMTLDEIFQLDNYIWENERLIPAEMFGDE